MESEGLVFTPIPTGPFATDIIRRRTDSFVRFSTPANRKGEGTGRLTPGGDAVEGIRVLLEGPDGPSLLGVNVRLPRGQRDLTETILTSAQQSQ
jgi:hypothetical protein